MTALKNARVAVLITDGFNQTEFDIPVNALKLAGALVEVLAPSSEKLDLTIIGTSHLNILSGAQAQKSILEAKPAEYDALLIPGGAISADEMRTSPYHRGFVRSFMESGKPLGVICHAPWLLADAGVISGKTVTSWPSIRKDLEHAGAVWVNHETVVDGNLLTSRMPDDMEAFSKVFIEMIQKYVQSPKKAENAAA